MHKKLNDFREKFTTLKKLTPQAGGNKFLKARVLANAGDVFNGLYYIYKGKYIEEKGVLNKKDINRFDYTKLMFMSTNLKKKNRLTKENYLKSLYLSKNFFMYKQGKTENYFKIISIFKGLDMLKLLHNTDSKKKNKDLVNMIKRGLSDLKDEFEKMSEDEKTFEQPDEIVNLVERIF